MFRLMEVRSLLKLSQKEVSESCRKASFWQRSACQTTTMSPLSAALITKCLRFFVLFSPVHSSHERLEILVLRLNLSLLIPWRYLLMTKSKDANWPSEGVHLDFWNLKCFEVSLFEVLESSSLSWKMAFNWTRQRHFKRLAIWKFVGFSEMRTKFKPLLRTDFSGWESGRFIGMVTTVLRLSGNESPVI